MERPKPQNDYFRTSARPLVDNPNYQPQQTQQEQPQQQQQQQQQQQHQHQHQQQPPPPHPPQPTLFPPSNYPQAPAQIPFADPFRRAPDAFLPNPQAQRREGYGLAAVRDAVSGAHAERPVLGGAWPGPLGTPTANGSERSHHQVHHHQHSHSHSHSHSGQSIGPPPQSLPAGMSGNVVATSYALDQAARRRSLGAQSPPSARYYPAPQGDPPPPPGLFQSRQMPPPSPSQQQQAVPYSAQRNPPPPPPFSSNRELPGLGSTSRPGTGMSISSLLGTDAPSSAPSINNSHQSPTPGSAQSPSGPSMQPPSPRRGQSLAAKLDYGQWSRQQTPDRHGSMPTSRPPENGQYPASQSPAMFSGPRQSPEFGRNGPPPLHHLYQSTTLLGPRPYQSSPTDIRNQEQHRQAEERIPPRPNSQPAGFAMPPREAGPREYPSPTDSRPPFHHYPQPERRDEMRHGPAASYDHQAAVAAIARDGPRPMTTHPVSHPTYSPPQDPRAPRDGREEVGRDNVVRRDGYAGPFRTGFRNQHYPAMGGPTEAPRSHPQVNEPFRRPSEVQHIVFGPEYRPQERPQPHSQEANQDRRMSEPQAHGEPMQYRTLSHESVSNHLMQRSRSSLGDGKRGRASPLPQAVQGAQPPPMGVGSDPSIKSEFGRIFQGLGYGGYGASTPTRGSPMPRSAPEGEAIVVSDGEGSKMSKIGSSRGRKASKRVKEEETRLDSESNDGRATPLANSGRSKRTKVGHHHHLHQHSHTYDPTNLQQSAVPLTDFRHHHHHGHVHRPEDAFTAPPTTTTPTGAHHHHHIHPSHHHHHGPRAIAPTPLVAPTAKPNVIVRSQDVFDSVKDRKRNHLGSELYSPVIELPPFATSSHTDDKFGYFSCYKPKRVFTDQDFNCTYTIRVPREYLTPASREKVCIDRNLHGTGIYTDDSDPIAMLIHSGWIRGEWGPDVGTSLMDLPPAPPDDEELDEETFDKPNHPVIPPDDMDLHITLVVLPRLVEYKGAVCFGVKSRDWDSEHDGHSWALLKTRWVDEGNSRAEERSGKARRARLAAAAQSLLELRQTRKIPNGKPGVERRLGVQVAA
ncbi:hypothetical protein FKW77_009752 [Venturia effusa]|uniref:Rxt3-domain-containing protein n=1 Tax=Venturia effusa TaxID=50376 RepID=A0A517LEN9_9PEZI|nr:hypothetical protein FKW77_009752 [Venturia effusa]